MAQKAIREYDGKSILKNWIGQAWEEAAVNPADAAPLTSITSGRLLSVAADGTPATEDSPATPFDWDAAAAANPWVHTTPLVVKPDQLIKRRGKAGLLKLNASWDEVKAWATERFHADVTVESVVGKLDTFLVEPFVPHADTEEFYICIQSHRGGEEVLFHHEGGVDVGDVDSKALRLMMETGADFPTAEEVTAKLLPNVPEVLRVMLASFIRALLKMYIDLHFVYLEINPLVVTGGQVHVLDMAAKVDEAAHFVVGSKWGAIDFPAPFGRPPYPEEAYIRDLDGKTGASLKLTILNRKGRVWTMVAGGGASVVYADTVADLGFGHELANYGEYSGAPSKDMTYEYAKTILCLMGQDVIEEPKVLIIGGGIANFTDVAATFTGIIAALKDYKETLHAHRVTIWVRRGGPNCQEGLRLIRDIGPEINVPIHVFGPETHITAIVPMALGQELDESMQMGKSVTEKLADGTIKMSDPGAGSGTDLLAGLSTPVGPAAGGGGAGGAGSGDAGAGAGAGAAAAAARLAASRADRPAWDLFDPTTRCVVFGMQTRAVQGMLDFDFLCKRKKPSVAAMVFPFSGNHYQKFYWGEKEIMLPVFSSTRESLEKNPDVDVFVNFASFRSVYGSTMEALSHPQLRTIAIIAEGVPEQHTRELIRVANEKKVTIIGPATVGGVKPGCFRIGNTGGMLDNIIACKLYRPGSVAYVSKSGGMSNELNNIISRVTNGVCEGVAIGGDRYPGTRFLDHMLRYQANPDVKMLVLLGEVGGLDEYDICAAIRDGRITKPIVAWCIGTCAKIFPFEVQFGHAGALANSTAQTADAKNKALREAGAVVPENFNDFVACIRKKYTELVSTGVIVEEEEMEPPRVPMDYSWAKKLGLVRKPAAFVSTISDERGEELLYAGMPISKVFEENVGVGGVVSLLWFKRRLPDYACKFIEMVLMVTADHGPAVSGAHNTIVTARAGKDLISSLCSGLLTIGPRFGGALDEAAAMFSKAHDSGQSPAEFVAHMRRINKLIMGIGHRIKSATNPDKRVTIIKEFALEHFPATDILRYALKVEDVTTKKKSNLILNVDGCIAACFVDLLRSCGAFTKEEADENIANGCLNGLFVLGRSIGFIGHFLDQKRLKQGLYRHPWDDISYQMEPGV